MRCCVRGALGVGCIRTGAPRVGWHAPTASAHATLANTFSSTFSYGSSLFFPFPFLTHCRLQGKEIDDTKAVKLAALLDGNTHLTELR